MELRTFSSFLSNLIYCVPGHIGLKKKENRDELARKRVLSWELNFSVEKDLTPLEAFWKIIKKKIRKGIWRRDGIWLPTDKFCLSPATRNRHNRSAKVEVQAPSNNTFFNYFLLINFVFYQRIYCENLKQKLLSFYTVQNL